ncbi:hypothetical protein FB45DRAFT_1018248 [Roridomyces roridus]|uniref:Uncharacterized protein n=1 Tax=Roridomyces roridus TaxID=1738132 RepID=A0AAD7FYZ8_9AGAR|nr:hypothetical protein FB45DRAFT_1018248 [Roridomyces roridus]
MVPPFWTPARLTSVLDHLSSRGVRQVFAYIEAELLRTTRAGFLPPSLSKKNLKLVPSTPSTHRRNADFNMGAGTTCQRAGATIVHGYEGSSSITLDLVAAL